MSFNACQLNRVGEVQIIRIPAGLSALPAFRIVEWHAEDGGRICAGDTVAEIEGAKTCLSVTSPASGIFYRNAMKPNIQYATAAAIGFLTDTDHRPPATFRDEPEVIEISNQQALGEALARHNRAAAVSRSVIRVAAAQVTNLVESLNVLAGVASASEVVAWIAAQLVTKHPRLNANIYGDRNYLNDDVHLGLVVDVGAGAHVPVLRKCNHLPLNTYLAAQKDLILTVARGELTPRDCANGTFSVSSMYSLDVIDFDPVLNVHQSSILGIGAVDEGHIRLVLAFDHRFVSGREAAMYLKQLKSCFSLPPDESPLASMSLQ